MQTFLFARGTPCEADSTETPDDEVEAQYVDQISGTADNGDVCAVDVSCHCVQVVRDLLAANEYALCVDYGAAFLATQSPTRAPAASYPGSGSTRPAHALTDSCEVLHCIAVACTRLGEIEQARGALSLLHKVLETSHHWKSKIEKRKWYVRYHLNTADLCFCNGQREEAIQEYALAWRYQALLYGPESLRCLRTYVTISEIKLQLVDDHGAQVMLQYAEQLLGSQEKSLSLWVTVRRLQGLVLERQRKYTAAVDVLRDVIACLHAAVPKMVDNPLEQKQAVVELATAMLQCCDIEMLDVDKAGPTSLASAFDLLSQAYQLLRDCFPPTHPLLVKAQLRLAQLYAHRGSVQKVLFSKKNAPSCGLNASTLTSTYFQQSFHDEAAGDASYIVADPLAGLKKGKAIVEQLLEQLNQEEVRGNKHIHTTIDVQDVLGDMLLRLEDFKAAAVVFGRALSTAKQLFAPDHERCAVLQHKLAEALLCTGHCEDAFHLLAELKEWCLLCPQGRMPPVPLVIIQHSLGNALRLMERFKDAEALYIEALGNPDCDCETRGKVLGNLAALKLTTADLPMAIHYNQQALTLRLGHLGEHHLDVAASYGNLADLCARNRQLKDAILHAERCMQTVERAMAPKLPGADAKRTPPTHGGLPAAPSESHEERARESARGSRVKMPPSAAAFRHHPFFMKASSIKAQCIRDLKKIQFSKISHSHADTAH